MIINSIHIKNFRSIVNDKILTSDISVFVGNNDAGKSNYLKALNLFFNNETDFKIPFEFERDYALAAPVRKKMAKEISITLELIPPPTYKEPNNIFWTKVWRQNGEVKSKERRVSLNHSKINGGRSRTFYWLDHIVFKYIPASKSNTYFQELLGDLHDTLSDSIEKGLFDAANEFTSKLKDSTIEITAEVNKRISIASNLELPNNLRSLFETLTFNTKVESNTIPLDNRGDGIKSRHIPIILKFISEQDNKTRTQGAPRISTIWGYEEPENNLELTKCFDLAKDFYEYSNEIQVFITTHSPAFYGIKYLDEVFRIKPFKKEKLKVYFIDLNKNPEHFSKSIEIDSNINYINDEMGLLPIITPYLKDKIIKINEQTKNIEILKGQILNYNIPTLYVEGLSDVKILEKGIELFDPSDLNNLIKNKKLLIKSKKSGGVKWVEDSILAWVYSRKEIKVAALFDSDNAGNESKKSIEENQKCKKAMQNNLLKIFQLPKPPHMQELYQNGVNIPLTLEECYPLRVWEYANSMGWLADRKLNEYVKNVPVDMSCKDYLLKEKKIGNQLLIYCTKTFKIEAKQKVTEHILNGNDIDKNDALIFLKPLVDKLQKYFL